LICCDVSAQQKLCTEKYNASLNTKTHEFPVARVHFGSN